MGLVARFTADRRSALARFIKLSIVVPSSKWLAKSFKLNVIFLIELIEASIARGLNDFKLISTRYIYQLMKFTKTFNLKAWDLSRYQT